MNTTSACGTSKLLRVCHARACSSVWLPAAAHLQARRRSAEVGAEQVHALSDAVDARIAGGQRQACCAVVQAQHMRAVPRKVHRIAAHAAEGIDNHARPRHPLYASTMLSSALLLVHAVDSHSEV